MKGITLIVHLPLPYFHGEQLFRTIRNCEKSYSKLGVGCIDSGIFNLDKVTSQANSLSDYTALDHRDRLKDVREAVLSYGSTRTVISFPCFRGRRMICQRGIFPAVEYDLKLLSNTFKREEIWLYIGLVDFRYLLSAIVKSNIAGSTFVKMNIPTGGFSWYDIIGACLDELPYARFVVWRHEESSFLWPRILQEVIGRRLTELPPGSLDMIANYIPVSELGKVKRHILSSSLRNCDSVIPVLEDYFRRFSAHLVEKRKRWLEGGMLRVLDAECSNLTEDMQLLAHEERVIVIQ